MAPTLQISGRKSRTGSICRFFFGCSCINEAKPNSIAKLLIYRGTVLNNETHHAVVHQNFSGMGIEGLPLNGDRQDINRNDQVQKGSIQFFQKIFHTSSPIPSPLRVPRKFCERVDKSVSERRGSEIFPNNLPQK